MTGMFELSPTSRLLRQKLRMIKAGETVTYQELSAYVSEKVDGSHPGLHSARNSILRKERINFEAIRGIGLLRLDDHNVVRKADDDVDRIRRSARKGALRLACVQDFAGLKPSDQLAHTTRMSIFTATAEMNSDRGIKKVEVVATGRAGELPIAETLRAFRSA